jgi:hypothetical protein
MQNATNLFHGTDDECIPTGYALRWCKLAAQHGMESPSEFGGRTLADW